MSKVDPTKLQKDHNLDRKSTLLLKAANAEIEKPHDDANPETAEAKLEDPGVDVSSSYLLAILPLELNVFRIGFTRLQWFGWYPSSSAPKNDHLPS